MLPALETGGKEVNIDSRPVTDLNPQSVHIEDMQLSLFVGWMESCTVAVCSLDTPILEPTISV